MKKLTLTQDQYINGAEYKKGAVVSLKESHADSLIEANQAVEFIPDPPKAKKPKVAKAESPAPVAPPAS